MVRNKMKLRSLLMVLVSILFASSASAQWIPKTTEYGGNAFLQKNTWTTISHDVLGNIMIVYRSDANQYDFVLLLKQPTSSKYKPYFRQVKMNSRSVPEIKVTRFAGGMAIQFGSKQILITQTSTLREYRVPSGLRTCFASLLSEHRTARQNLQALNRFKGNMPAGVLF